MHIAPWWRMPKNRGGGGGSGNVVLTRSQQRPLRPYHDGPCLGDLHESVSSVPGCLGSTRLCDKRSRRPPDQAMGHGNRRRWSENGRTSFKGSNWPRSRTTAGMLALHNLLFTSSLVYCINAYENRDSYRHVKSQVPRCVMIASQLHNAPSRGFGHFWKPTGQLGKSLRRLACRLQSPGSQAITGVSHPSTWATPRLLRDPPSACRYPDALRSFPIL